MCHGQGCFMKNPVSHKNPEITSPHSRSTYFIQYSLYRFAMEVKLLKVLCKFNRVMMYAMITTACDHDLLQSLYNYHSCC